MNNISCIDIVNPYIKSLGSTDIISDSDRKTLTVSPDQGATSTTAIIVPKEFESEWLQFLKQRKEDKEFHQHMNVVYEMLDQVPMDEEKKDKLTGKKND